jgi:hypothetical protein
MTASSRLYQVLFSLGGRYAEKADELLPPDQRKAELERRFREELTRHGSFESELAAVRKLGREFTPEEARRLHQHYVKIGWIIGADKTTALLGRELSRDELVQICDVALEKRCDGIIAFAAAKRLPAGDRKSRGEKIIVHLLERLDLDLLEEVTAFFGRRLNYRELSSLCAHFIEYGDLRKAQRVATLRGNPLSEKEIVRIAENANRVKHHDSARNAALLLPETGRTQYLGKALVTALESYNLGAASEIAVLLGRVLTEAEISRALTAALKHNEGAARNMVKSASYVPWTRILMDIIETNRENNKYHAEKAADLLLRLILPKDYNL